jgi:hypothetical protein
LSVKTFVPIRGILTFVIRKGDFAVVRYHVFSVGSSEPHDSTKTDDLDVHPLDGAEVELRNQDVLVAKDVEKEQIWVFDHASPILDANGKPKPTPPPTLSVDGINFTRECGYTPFQITYANKSGSEREG